MELNNAAANTTQSGAPGDIPNDGTGMAVEALSGGN
jgi:hypothetical protein